MSEQDIRPTGETAVAEYVSRGRSLPEVLDLETCLAALPVLNAWLRRAMDFKGRAEMVVEDHLTSIEGRQRIYGGTAFGLKDGGWTIAPADAAALLDFLTPFAGEDFTQAQLDAGIKRETIYVAGNCPDDGEFAVPVACPKCGVVSERMVVNHTGLNAIAKVARAEVKKRLDGTSPETLRRRSAPSLTLKSAV